MNNRPVRLVLRSGQVYDIDPTFTDSNGEECSVVDQYGVGMARMFRPGQRVTVHTQTSTVVVCSDEIAAVEVGDNAASRRPRVSEVPSVNGSRPAYAIA